MLSRLTRLSEEFNVAVLLTNQVQSDPGASAMFAGADKKPASLALPPPPSQSIADMVRTRRLADT